MAVKLPFKAVPGGIQQLTAADLVHYRYLLRNKYANDADQIGWLSINANTSWTTIGSYVDQYRSTGISSVEAVYNDSGTQISGSTDPADPTSASTTYTFYQNRSAASLPSVAIQNAGILVTDTGYDVLAPMNKNEQDVFDTIIDETIREIENGGNGKFYLGTTVPSGYTSIGDVALNTQTTPGVAGQQTTTYQLSIRTGEVAPAAPSHRPIRYGGGRVLQTMTTDEIIDYLYPFLLRRIGQGSRLHYTLSTSTTGVDCGSLTENYYTGTSGITAAHTGGPAAFAFGNRTFTYSQSVQGLQTTTYYLRLTDT